MRTKLSGVVFSGMVAFAGFQAGATTITPSTSVETGEVSVTETGLPDPRFGILSYTWNMFTEEGTGGTNSVSFLNETGLPARATYVWSLLSNSDQDITRSVLSFENGDEFVLAENTVGASGGPLQFTLPENASISFFLTTDGEVPGAQAAGQITFAPIPLPAGALLLLTALGGLAATRRFKKSSEAA